MRKEAGILRVVKARLAVLEERSAAMQQMGLDEAWAIEQIRDEIAVLSELIHVLTFCRIAEQVEP